MAQTQMNLYGVFDVATGNLVGVCPINGVVSTLAGAPITISGTNTVGSVLTATLSPGWSVTGYQWTRDGTNIAGATSSTYTLVSADQTHAVACNVSGLISRAAVNVS